MSIRDSSLNSSWSVVLLHTASFWNITVQWTSHDDLTEKICRYFFHFTETALTKKLVKWQKFKTALCNLTKNASVEFCQIFKSIWKSIVTQQCHVAIHNFYLRTALQWGLCVSMSILISKLPLPCSLGLQSSYFLQSSIREETRIVRFLFLWEMGLLGSQSSSKENILLLRTFFFEFSCTWKCKRKAFVKFMFSKKRTKFDKIFTVHLTLLWSP